MTLALGIDRGRQPPVVGSCVSPGWQHGRVGFGVITTPKDLGAGSWKCSTGS
jgi:hypothetical protein